MVPATTAPPATTTAARTAIPGTTTAKPTTGEPSSMGPVTITGSAILVDGRTFYMIGVDWNPVPKGRTTTLQRSMHRE